MGSECDVPGTSTTGLTGMMGTRPSTEEDLDEPWSVVIVYCSRFTDRLGKEMWLDSISSMPLALRFPLDRWEVIVGTRRWTSGETDRACYFLDHRLAPSLFSRLRSIIFPGRWLPGTVQFRAGVSTTLQFLIGQGHQTSERACSGTHM